MLCFVFESDKMMRFDTLRSIFNIEVKLFILSWFLKTVHIDPQRATLGRFEYLYAIHDLSAISTAARQSEILSSVHFT